MEILILILLIISLFINGFILYMVFLKQNKQPKETKPKMTREEKEKQKEIKTAFENLMRYDEKSARKNRK